jgi:transcriptional regulator with XRE-family HTH domain
MITRDDLLKSSEYWIEIIQNKVFNDVTEYIESKGISNKELAAKLGLSKGRISQILSGENLNFRLDTLVKLCLAIERVPDFRLSDINDFIERDTLSASSISFTEYGETNIMVENFQRYIPGNDSKKIILYPIITIHSKDSDYSETKLINSTKAA